MLLTAISSLTFISIGRCQIGLGLHQSYLQLSKILPGVKIELLAAGVIHVCDEACRGWLWLWRGSKIRSVNISSTFVVAILVHMQVDWGRVTYCVPKLQSLGVWVWLWHEVFVWLFYAFLNQFLTSIRYGTCYDSPPVRWGLLSFCNSYHLRCSATTGPQSRS